MACLLFFINLKHDEKAQIFGRLSVFVLREILQSDSIEKLQGGIKFCYSNFVACGELLKFYD